MTSSASDPITGKSPAFQFYPTDFLSDPNVIAMSLLERGAYITLICLCWQKPLPSDPARLARLCGTTATSFTRIWPALEPCFRVANDDPAHLIHPRLERERAKQAIFSQKQAENGRHGGRPRKPTLNPKEAVGFSGETQTEPKRSSSSSSSSLDQDLKSTAPAAAADPSPTAPGVTETPDVVRSFPSKASGSGCAEPCTEVQTARFARFWDSYPNKKGKQSAWRAWLKLHPSEALTELVCAALAQQRTWDTWTREGGRFIPHPASWLNAGRWDDEPAAAPDGIFQSHSGKTAGNAAALRRFAEK